MKNATVNGISIWLVTIALVAALAACATTSGPKPPATGKAAEFAAFDAVVEKSFATLDGRLAAGSRIALLPLNAEDKNNGGYAYDTLTVMFTNAGKYDMVERARIDQIIQEQNFQMTGIVSDETAVSIGKFLGAQVIIIGDISGSGNTRRLVFRALDVETGKILGISSERF
jgi:curli biogenesis system outer membrane secretion channel CsgG